MKQVKRNSPLYAYLDATDAFDKGGDAIKKAKQEYRKQYLKKYKKERANRIKEFSITCSKEEEKRLTRAAQEHGLTPCRFLKKVAFAYLEQAFVVPHISNLHQVEQLLLSCASNIERIAEKEPGAWYKHDRNYTDLEKTIDTTHKQIVELFAHPLSLDAVITEAIRNNPGYLKTLKNLINHHDIKEHVAQ